MQLPERIRLLCLGLVAFVPIASAQIKSSAPAQSDHPVYKLVFKPQAAIPELKPSLFAPPILCSPGGTAYYGVPEQPTYREMTIHQLDLKQPRSFGYRQVEGLYDARFIAFFPDEAELYVLINASQDSEQAREDAAKQIGTYISVSGLTGRHDFLLKFDRSGRYVNRIQLPDQLNFARFAVFEDGSFLALGVERATAAVRLVEMSADGKIVRYLALPSALRSSASESTEMKSSQGEIASAEAKLGRWFFVPVRHKVLLFARDINQVLEIGPDGVRREVDVAIPKGYFFDSIISSNDRWLFLVPRQVEWDPGKFGGKLTSRDYTVYEVDFNDGRFIREMKGAPTPGLGIACERDGVFTGFSIGRDANYVLWTAELPR